MEAYVLPSDLRKCSSMKTSQLTGERLSPTALFITISPLLCMLLIRFLIGGGGAFVITLGRVFRFIGTSGPQLLALLLQLLDDDDEFCRSVEGVCTSATGDIEATDELDDGCRSESFRRTVMSRGVSESTSIGLTGGGTVGIGGRWPRSYGSRSYFIGG